MKKETDDIAESVEHSQPSQSFMELYEESLKSIQEGKVVRGEIVQIDKEYALIDIGYKSEGQIRIAEFMDPEGRLTVKVGDHVDVTGNSKGRGFAGVVKRHGFRGGPKTHGQSDRQRAPGSIGATSGTARVFKGKRMPGHMGNRRVTSQNLEIVLVDAERNLIGVRGAVPGPKGGLLVIKEARKQ